MNRPTELAADAGQQAWARPAILVPVLGLVSAIGGFLPSFSPAANVYVLLVGGAMFWLGMSGRVARQVAPAPARPGSDPLLAGGALSGDPPPRAADRPAGPVAAPIGRGVLWWLVPLTVLVAAELVNFALGSTPDHPTLSLLADPLLDHYLPRALGYCGWLVAFWGLVRR